MIIVALRIDRDRAACPPRENIKRIFVGPVIDAEHDHRTHARPQHTWIGTAFRMRGEPIHIAMRAGVEESAKMFRRVRDRIRSGNADAIETERARLVGQRGLQIYGRKLDRRLQKSRST